MILAVGAFFLFSWGRNLENSNDGDLADDLGGGSNYDLIDGPGGEPGEDAEAFEEYGEIPEDLGPVE